MAKAYGYSGNVPAVSDNFTDGTMEDGLHRKISARNKRVWSRMILRILISCIVLCTLSGTTRSTTPLQTAYHTADRNRSAVISRHVSIAETAVDSPVHDSFEASETAISLLPDSPDDWQEAMRRKATHPEKIRRNHAVCNKFSSGNQGITPGLPPATIIRI